MDSDLSLSTVLASLAGQIAHHREQEAGHAGRELFHREREAFHRQERAAHAAELAELTSRYDSFKAAAEAAAELAARALPPAPAEPAAGVPEPPDDPAPGRRLSIAAAVAVLIDVKGPGERFGPRGLADEVNRRYAARLGRTVDVRQVSVALRWLAATGRIVRIERGNPHRDAKYVRARGE